MSRIPHSIEDENEFKDIIRGLIRKNLRRYISQNRIIIPERDGKKATIVSSHIEIPRLKYKKMDNVGVAQGDGDVGDDLGPKKDPSGQGTGGGGDGGPTIDIEIPIEDLQKAFQGELELPNIQPKGDKTCYQDSERWTSISKTGPNSMVHKRRTMYESLKRAIATGQYIPPDKINIIPMPDDFRYKSYEVFREPKNNAVCFWCKDGSGSVGQEEMEVVARLVGWSQYWLSCFYDQLDDVYLIHSDKAIEVNRDPFFSKTIGGGTVCSSVLDKILNVIQERYPVDEWNIYITYVSDGLNFSEDDDKFLELFDRTISIVNQFNYGEIELERPWLTRAGSDEFFDKPGTIGNLIKNNSVFLDNVSMVKISSSDEDGIIKAIKAFFGKGN
jgi:uncharacterized protein